MITYSTKQVLVDSVCWLENEKIIFCQYRRRYVYDIISDAAVTSNKLYQQIKQAA